MESRCIRQLFSCCPTAVGTYAAMHLDSIGKILNHILMMMMACNIILFLNAWSVAFLPVLGFDTGVASFFLCLQNVVVWLILNNNHIAALSFLSPTQLMIGLALGITIGGSILAFVVTIAFRHAAKCETMASGTLLADACKERRGTIHSICFWSGLVFWLNFCTSLLLAVGSGDLARQGEYENIGVGATGTGMTMEDYEGHFQNQRYRNNETNHVSIPDFVGDYSTIPEIRSAVEEVAKREARREAAGRSTEADPVIQTV